MQHFLFFVIDFCLCCISVGFASLFFIIYLINEWQDVMLEFFIFLERLLLETLTHKNSVTFQVCSLKK